MKTSLPLPFARQLNSQRARASLATLVGLVAFEGLADDFTNPADTLPDTGNYIDVTIGYAEPNGNEAAFLARNPVKKHYYGGIERFHYEDYIGSYTEFSVDGRAMVDNNDYLFKMSFLNEDVGYLNFEWQKYRVWYDGSGRYFPGGDTFVDIYDDELALDRGKLEISGGLFLEDMPDLEFRYIQLTREGLKSSTSLADTNLTGGYGTRNIVPTFWDIDETRHIFEASASDKFGSTKAKLSLRLEEGDTDNARKITRRPGESAFRRITHREQYDSDLFGVRATTITDLSEKTILTTGIAYTETDVNATGGRIYGSEFDAPFDVDFQSQRRDHGWTDLVSDSKIDQWLLNANLVTRPAKHWKTIYSVRLEESDTSIDATHTETEFSTSTNVFEIEEGVEITAERDWSDIALSAEAIYTGQEDAVYNVAALYTTGDGDFIEDVVEDPDGLRFSNTERDVMKISAGAKFYPTPNLRYYVQAYHKERDNKFTHIVDPEPGQYPAFTSGQDFTTDDLNVSVRWNGNGNLSGMTRIDYQNSTIDSQGQGLDWAHSYDRKALVFSQSLTLSFDNLFIQAYAVYADDQRDSPVSTIGGGVADTVIVLDGDFWNGNISAHWSIDEDSSAALSFFTNRVDNYVDNSEFAQPYGEDLKEYGATATYTRRLSENTQITFRYSYFDSEDKASGGYNDYDAHVAYSTLRYRF